MIGDYSDDELVGAVLDWAEENENFDTTFVESLAEHLESRGDLSEKQRTALENIIISCKIDVSAYV